MNKTNNRSILEKIELICLPLSFMSSFYHVMADGYATGYTDWSTTQTSYPDEKTATGWRYSDVTR